MSNFSERWAELPDLLAGHMRLSASALCIGIALSLPLGVLAARRPKWRGPVLGVTGLVQTIPSLALLALMVPLLGGQIGFVPALLALTLYSMLPVLHNTVTGIQEVDPGLTEAARGIGMTPWQSLLRVELPLAAPVILAGIRTASVWVIGTATLATPVGAQSLGNYIFLGLQTRNGLAVVFGCVAASLLAVAFDRLIAVLESAAKERSRGRLTAGLLGLALITFGSLWPAFDFTSSLDTRGPALVGSDAPKVDRGDALASVVPGRPITVGSKGFTEQYVLAELLGEQLTAHGFEIDNRPNLGSTILFDALREGTVDVCIDYSGTLWATILKRDEPAPRLAMQIEVASVLLQEHGVVTLGSLGFENAYALAMARKRAEELGVRSLTDLARVTSQGQAMEIGGDPEFFGRPEWSRVRAAYGLEGIETRGMDSTFLYGAARDGQIDVITAYTTDGRITAFDLQLLEDPDEVLPPYDAMILLSARAAGDPGLVRALKPLLNAISNEEMRVANRAVDLDGATVASAAAALRARILD
ncbi:MAG: ABC transporter permease/substrate-binding protein [Planctomycetota bacterium]|nr:ABC transporter permease/substrate-binding protein [Planctomycetota bacterium]MDG2142842.1 ABC transporter permease/substrate-binding protein [Planctomycetota bacterium]